MESYNFEITANKEVAVRDLGFALLPIDEIKPEHQPNEATHHPGDMILCAILPDGSEQLFLIDPEHDPGFKKWSMHLFYEATEYYCQVVLDQKPEGVQMVNMAAFYPYNC